MRNGLLEYEDYVNLSLSEPVSEALFNRYLQKAYFKLNRMCNNRLASIETIPDEVKFTLVEFIDILYATNEQTTLNLSSYSNGIESFGYQIDAENPEKSVNSLLYQKARENLADNSDLTYSLLYRGLDV